MKKNKLTNFLKIGILFFGVALLLWNCEKENSDLTIESQQTISIEKVQKQFNTSFNRNAFSNLTIPQWENVKVFYNDEGNQYLEIPFQTIRQEDMEKGTSVSLDKLIAISKNNKINLTIVHFFGLDIKNNPINLENISHTQLSNFSGFITHYDLNKNTLEIKKYEKGIDTKQKVNIKGKSKDSVLYKAIDEDVTEYSETTCTRTCMYTEYTDGSRVYNYCGPWSCYTITFQIYGSGNYGNEQNTSYNSSHIISCQPGYKKNYDGKCVLDEQIVNNLTGKADCTYQKLENNSLLKNTIKKFIGQNTPVNLIINQKSNLRDIDDDNTSDLVNGKTYYGGTSANITISLNTEQSINRPSLAVARTILHEAIHAEIYRKIKTTSGMYYDSSNYEWRLPDGSRAHFPTLFDNFNEDPNNPHHNYMANYYRTAMEDGLKEFAASIGETHSDQFYKDLVWNGLLDTKAWENQYADPNYANSEKNRIKNVIISYENSTNNECQ